MFRNRSCPLERGLTVHDNFGSLPASGRELALAFIYSFTILFNVGQTIVTKLIKINLTNTNTDVVDKNFKVFDMQHKNSESFVNDSISV